MSEPLARDIELLVELFKAGGWSELRVESDAISLLLSTDTNAVPIGGQVVVSAAPVGAAPAAHAVTGVPVPAADSVSAVADIDPAWIAVAAPNLGTFYRSPKPGSPAFVDVGQHVDADTEVCLIEVMKLFTSVQAGVAGTVRSIVAADGALVEGGQVLLYVQHD